MKRRKKDTESRNKTKEKKRKERQRKKKRENGRMMNERANDGRTDFLMNE